MLRKKKGKSIGKYTSQVYELKKLYSYYFYLDRNIWRLHWGGVIDAIEEYPRGHRVTPRRLSFNLDDFIGTEGEREGETSMPDFLNVQPRPTGARSSHSQEELNLIQNLETPAVVTGNAGGDTQLLVPAAVLNNILAGQRNLANMVTGLSLIVNAQRAAGVEKTMHSPPNTILDLEPPLANAVITAPYPNGYQPPTFRKFDETRSAKEHIMSFLDDLGIYRSNKSLRLKEFSKSLSGRVFTWYAKLRPYSIETWEDLVMEFCGKFLEEEGVIHIMDLGRVKQRAGKGLVAFIKQYRDRALQCKETLPEVDLVYGCIKNVEDGSHIFLSLSGITTFTELMKKAADVADAMKRQGKRTKGQEDMFDVYAAEEREIRRPFKSNRTPEKMTPRNTNEMPPIPLGRIQICQLVEDWLKEGTLRMKVVKPPLTKKQYDNPEYCVLHKTNSHSTQDCWTIRRAFHKQVKLGTVLLLEEHQDEDLDLRPLPNHSVNTITPSSEGIRIEEVEEGPCSKERMLAVGLAKTRGFRVLFGQLGMGHDAQREAADAIINIARKWGGHLEAVNAPLTRLARAHTTAIIFREPTDISPQFCHNQPLYVEATIEGVKVRRALVDNGSRVNILPTYIFHKLRMPKNRMRRSDITLSTLHGEVVESLGRVHSILEVGPLKTVNVFQVVDGDASYHLLLGRPWIHLHQCVPSTLHQCVKSNFKGKEIEIPGVKVPFEATEAHLIDASLFDEMAPPGSSQSEQGTPLLGNHIQQDILCRPTQAFKRPRARDAAGI
ncbi:Aspartic peptidase domain superfamily [Sesbania bispinosa]|nr:Aspartic peptidase domain superfamily [Sesbania bispinosa]